MAEGKKRVALAAAVIIAVALPWWGPLALRPMAFFAVRRVEVVGARYLPADEVVRALGLGQPASVWDDLDALEGRIRAMPGVAEAQVQRRLPGTLRVSLREVEPVALAEGPVGLVPVGRDGRPLPYDPASAPVDAPVVARVEPAVLAALAQIQATDPGLFAEVSAARAGRGGAVELELEEGIVRFEAPMDPEVIRSVSAVRRDLAARAVLWRELDARFKGWVIVRPRAAATGGAA
ncbi:MAG: FtsQ-type POTRA domain-containing protein [Gemmatimonadales bacterium]|nr:FtsQ-type POTRA domain-containing protein [Gemmatimonadales bacterium]